MGIFVSSIVLPLEHSNAFHPLFTCNNSVYEWLLQNIYYVMLVNLGKHDKTNAENGYEQV